MLSTFINSTAFLFLLFLPFFTFLFAFGFQNLFSRVGLFLRQSSGLGKKFSYYFSTAILATILCAGSVMVSFFMSCLLLFTTTTSYAAEPVYFIVVQPSESYGWVEVGSIFQNFSFQFDALSSVMLFVITSISFLVHLYSYGYLGFDPFYIRFLSFLNLFTFFMMLLVSSGNLLQLFVGWEGVGLSSYLLINFWHTRREANKSAIKAITLNRVGDVSLLLSVVVALYAFGTTSFPEIFTLVQNLSSDNLPYFLFFGFELDVLLVFAWLLLIAAVAKSAQFGLHTWLPDAMEGPTPVSALLHAATMVTAGVYLIVRFSYLFELVESARNFCVIIGSITVLFGSLTALVQFDIKKIIAFSTTSQLGYMFVACGLSGYHIAMYHLVTHAFFKALLFLTAGVIIHSMNNEQDIRKMGQVKFFAPLTYLFMFTGFLSLSGTPFLGGFFSKDAIIELAYAGSSDFSYFAFFACLFGALLTGCYSVRVLYYVFFYKPRVSSVYKGFYDPSTKRFVVGDSIHDISYYNFFVLLPLFFGSIFAGYLFYDSFVGIGSNFWCNSIYIQDGYNTIFYEFFVPFYIKLLPIFFSFSAYLVTFMLYYAFGGFVDVFFSLLRPVEFFPKFFRKVYSYMVKKWFFDVIYNKFIVAPFFQIARLVYVKVDKGYLESFGPFGISIFFSEVAGFLRRRHSNFERYLLLVALVLLVSIPAVIYLT